MAATSQAQRKICVLCREDCSTQSRVKDRFGCYYCKSCHDAARKRRAGEAALAPPAGVAPDDLEEIALRPCPSCDYPLTPIAIICHKCGYDRRRRRHVRTVIEPSEEETETPGPSVALSSMRAAATSAARRILAAGVMPAAAAIASVAIVSVALLTIIDSRAAGQYLTIYLIHLPIGVAIFWMCSALWIGFNESALLTTLRLAAIYAFADLAFIGWLAIVGWLAHGAGWAALGMADRDLLALAMIGGGRLGLLIPVGVSFALHAKSLDLDLTDSAMVSALTLVSRAFVIAAVVWIDFALTLPGAPG